MPTALVVALLAIVLARAGLAHLAEVSGRRAATGVLSRLRVDLVRRFLRPGAPGPCGGSAALAPGAVQGVDGLETYDDGDLVVQAHDWRASWSALPALTASAR